MNSKIYSVEMLNKDRAEFPEDWIILNPKDAPFAHNAHVIEVKHGDRYNTPHFLYFSTNDAITTEENDHIRATAATMWPKLYSILDDEIEPVIGKDGHIENLDEAADAPCVGVFMLPDKSSNPSMTYPHNAKIVRASKDI